MSDEAWTELDEDGDEMLYPEHDEAEADGDESPQDDPQPVDDA